MAPLEPQDFVNMAASSGMFEVQSSELALERAGSDEVKDFARMMIRDHGELNEQLKAVAAARGLTVPAEIAGPPAQHMEAVMGAEGDRFDQAYLDHQVQAHAEAIALYAQKLARKRPGGWQLLTIDSEGMDLGDGDERARIFYPEPLQRAGDLRKVLKQMADAARAMED